MGLIVIPKELGVVPKELGVVDEKRAASELARIMVDYFRPLRSVAVALSGGVDSAVVAAAASRALGPRSLALTAQSPSVSRYQLQWAQRTATEIGIEHQLVSTAELEKETYRRNQSDRCYWCKQTLYETLLPVVRSRGFEQLASGTNREDLGDYRPGLRAGEEKGVLTPLAELGLVKDDVRRLAQYWGLAVWDLPASPCLASRIVYGVEVTADRLRMIEEAEALLRGCGIDEFRVRLHEHELARIEVPLPELTRLVELAVRGNLANKLRNLGFKFVSLDLEGFRSGRINEIIQISSKPV